MSPTSLSVSPTSLSLARVVPMNTQAAVDPAQRMTGPADERLRAGLAGVNPPPWARAARSPLPSGGRTVYRRRP